METGQGRSMGTCPLVTGHWAGVFLQEALSLSHTVPGGRAGTSPAVGAKEMVYLCR